MVIGCTKKLLDTLEIQPQKAVADPLFCWTANVITMEHRKMLVLVNNSNRYAAVLYGMKAKDWQNLPKLVPLAIEASLKANFINPAVIEHYLASCGEIAFAKTQGSSMVARMNKVCELIERYDDHLVKNSLFQPAICAAANNMIYKGSSEKEYFYPYKIMAEELAELASEPAYRIPAAEMTVRLEMEKYNVWRRLTIPLDISFAQLHNVLQVAFDWKDCHLHEFHLLDKEGKTVLTLVESEEDLDYAAEFPNMLEQEALLSDYLPRHKTIVYNYDFGDEWRHTIKIDKLVVDSTNPYPTCTLAEGTAPPEDVGGEYGYTQFLEAISNKTHPDDEANVAWGMVQRYGELDLHLVNLRLKSALTKRRILW